MVPIAAASLQARTGCRVASKGTRQGLAPRTSRSRAGARRRRSQVFRRFFVPEASSARMLRAALKQYLTDNGINGHAMPQIMLCADEAFINAVQHAPASLVGVAAKIHGDRLVLEVTDGGPGFDPRHLDEDALPDLMGEHGRGLFLIRRLADDFEVLSDDRGTTLRMALGLASASRTTPDTGDTKGGRIS